MQDNPVIIPKPIRLFPTRLNIYHNCDRNVFLGQKGGKTHDAQIFRHTPCENIFGPTKGNLWLWSSNDKLRRGHLPPPEDGGNQVPVDNPLAPFDFKEDALVDYIIRNELYLEHHFDEYYKFCVAGVGHYLNLIVFDLIAINNSLLTRKIGRKKKPDRCLHGCWKHISRMSGFLNVMANVATFDPNNDPQIIGNIQALDWSYGNGQLPVDSGGDNVDYRFNRRNRFEGRRHEDRNERNAIDLTIWYDFGRYGDQDWPVADPPQLDSWGLPVNFELAVFHLPRPEPHDHDLVHLRPNPISADSDDPFTEHSSSSFWDTPGYP